MSKISGIRDLDREILGKVDDNELLKVCLIDKYTWNIVCDDAFLRRRLLSKYPEVVSEKLEEETWKQFFRRAIYYISKMKEEYGYEYSFGNFVTQYNLHKHTREKNENEKDALLIYSAREGELSLVIWCLKNWANIHSHSELCLREACSNGHLEVVKYSVENNANIHAIDDDSLRLASYYGNTLVVKYLVEHGANIHARNEQSLLCASCKGHLEVVIYLVERGAIIHHEILTSATLNGHKDVVNFLKSVKND
jgi:hypothetical protein